MPLRLNARNIKELFISEPGDVIPLLSQSVKMDMLDYLDAGRMAEVNNALGKGTHFNKVTDNYMSIQVTKSSCVELLLMPVSATDSIIIAITTFNLPAKDSRIDFYTTDWGKYVHNERFFKEPSLNDFIYIPKGVKTKKEDIFTNIDFPVIQYVINPDKYTITATNNIKDYMSKEDYEKVSPYLCHEIEYIFKDGKFHKSKSKSKWYFSAINHTFFTIH